MGIKQSRYETSSIQNYYKLSPEEYSLIKQLWKEIENKPQYYGNLFFTSFLGTYPQYIKYYTLNTHIPLGVDVRLCAKFTLIMEAIGYLVVDVYRNRKQLDRLVGYVAMVHKDMRLNKEDMTNFEMSFMQYLEQTFPMYMTGKCQRAMKMYFNSIVNGIVNKMEKFRYYEMTETEIRSRPYFGHCTLCVNNLVFGQTMTYWNDRKKDWDTLLNMWNIKNSSLEQWLDPPISYNNATKYTSKIEDKTIELPEWKVEPNEKNAKNSVKFVTSSAVEETTDDDKKDESKDKSWEYNRSTESKYRRKSSEISNTSPWEQAYSAKMNPRERFRAFSMFREVIDPQDDPRIVRTRLRSSRIATRPINYFDQNGEEAIAEHVEHRKFENTARERRRESQKFSFDLK
ncbi:hypothetical protein V1478_009040 [Vespula squamosa]|uniref:Globin family profile domain-containing protein n=1 Tax=Vespula squamosa TaxID=30214 RepID=A0ABD2AV74_VESSQ